MRVTTSSAPTPAKAAPRPAPGLPQARWHSGTRVVARMGMASKPESELRVSAHVRSSTISATEATIAR